MAPNTDIATRALVVTLKSPIVGQSTNAIAEKTGLSTRTINLIYARAVQRGFDPNILPLIIKNQFLEDAPRSGRPTKQTEEMKQSIAAKVRGDRYGRELSSADLAGYLSTDAFEISATTIWRCLKNQGFKKTKPTRKPGLTKKMKDERLKWCLDHQDWTLDDWKNVIWTDETAVVLNHRRGGYRVWRTSEEPFVKSCIRERWKGYSEFMFWGSFSYEKKGPCHCYMPETKKEKDQAEKKILEMNTILEPILRTEWELETGMERIGLQTRSGAKPQWRWDNKHGKLVRQGGKGIDWWRYQACVLIPKLIPFAKDCQKDRPNTIVQEDKAPSHAH
jgi:transposase